MKNLSIDLETYSDVDLLKCGVYKYAQSDNFEILLFGVSVNNGPVVVYDLTSGDEIPALMLQMEKKSRKRYSMLLLIIQLQNGHTMPCLKGSAYLNI